ncbi:unnamed protein product, partial [Ixodes hexagonus]
LHAFICLHLSILLCVFGTSKMAALLGRSGQIAVRRINFPLAATTRTAHYWNKDWKPGPYPKTPEERAAAAKKYGLLPEDYRPFPENDDSSRGDYPDLPDIGASARDPEESYDFPYLRRNYGEPLHLYAEVFTQERVDTSRLRIPLWKQAVAFLSVFIGIFVVKDIFDHEKLRMGMNPVLQKRQLPLGGKVVHYTFEPED